MDPKPLYRAIDINGLKNPDVKVKDIKEYALVTSGGGLIL